MEAANSSIWFWIWAGSNLYHRNHNLYSLMNYRNTTATEWIKLHHHTDNSPMSLITNYILLANMLTVLVDQLFVLIRICFGCCTGTSLFHFQVKTQRGKMKKLISIYVLIISLFDLIHTSLVLVYTSLCQFPATPCSSNSTKSMLNRSSWGFFMIPVLDLYW